jgi:hypothetical protein
MSVIKVIHQPTLSRATRFWFDTLTGERKKMLFEDNSNTVILDSEDLHIINNKTVNYSNMYPTVWHEGRNVAIHRLVMGKAPDGLEVDHKNGNPLDSRRSNLRFVTHGDNLRNRRAYSKSGHKGVYFSKNRQGKQWQVQRRVNGRNVNFGWYRTLDEAYKASVLAFKALDRVV